MTGKNPGGGVCQKMRASFTASLLQVVNMEDLTGEARRLPTLFI